MVKLGFIGYGSMGSMLLNGLLASRAVQPDEVFVATRTQSRLEPAKARWEGLKIAANNLEVVSHAQYIFLCVKPLEVKDVLVEVKEAFSPDKHLISIAGPVALTNLERLVPGKVSKLIPSLTAEVREGISLICHNSKVTPADAALLKNLLEPLSKIMEIPEQDFPLATEFTSCGPGLFAAILQELLEAGLTHSQGITREQANEMILRTLYGTAKLLIERELSFPETINRVATKGGITEEGVKVLQAGLPELFDEMFRRMLEKRDRVGEEVNRGFGD